MSRLIVSAYSVLVDTYYGNRSVSAPVICHYKEESAPFFKCIKSYSYVTCTRELPKLSNKIRDHAHFNYNFCKSITVEGSII